MKFFGSSGIRGIVNSKITPDLALKVGKALGMQYSKVIIGRDPRPSGQMVVSGLNAGLTASGADVYDAGMLSTPSLAYAAREYDCGIMVTASHNPAPYNGIKLWNPDGSAFDTGQMKVTEEGIESDIQLPGWDCVGSIYEHRGAVKSHIEHILKKVGRKHHSKVVIDCANGAACNTTPYLLKEMGCQVITLNSNPDGSFPAHDPEPTEENFANLGELVRKTGADMGIAHDGDGDRMVAFDSEGCYLSGDMLLSIFASRYSDSVVVPVNASMVLDELTKKVVRTKVGDVYVAEELKRQGAQFGGEPSGTWIFPEMSFAPDAIYAAALLVCMNEERDLSEARKTMPTYPGRRRAITVEDNASVMNCLLELYRNTYDIDSLNTVDGIRVQHNDGWALTRASGTEPKIRITAEAKDESVLDRIFNEANELLKEACQ